jgi:hypothetical protein
MIIPILIGIIRLQRLTLPQKLIWYLMIYTLVTELLSMWYIDFYDAPIETKNNLPIFHSYSYLEYGVVAFIFYKKAKILTWRKTILALSIFYYAFSIINVLNWESIWEFNSNQRFVEAILIFIVLVGFFVQLLRNVEDVYFERNPYFWLSTGYFIYFAGTLFVFLFEKKFTEYAIAMPKEEYIDYHGYIHGVIFILLILHYSMFLWLKEKN